MKNETICVGMNPMVTLETFLLENDASRCPRPLVVVCPGGGFMGCSPNEGAPVTRMLNGAGFHAAVLTYSTQATATNASAYPQALYDLADALCLVRAQAEAWDVDVNKVAILGFSAGGWLCAQYENTWSTMLFEGHGTAEERRPNACVLCYPLVDYRGYGMCQRDEADLAAVLGAGAKVQMDAFVQAMNRAFLGERALTDALVSEVSPLDHIGPNTPPTFVWTTFGDGLLDPTQSLAYARRLHAAGVPCELHVFQEGFHGLSLATETTAHKPEQVDPHVAHWAEMACEWLRSAMGAKPKQA